VLAAGWQIAYFSTKERSTMPILPDDAILRRLPVHADVGQRVWLESVGRCVDIFDVHYSRLASLLERLGTREQVPEPFGLGAALADAWGALDAAYKFNLLLRGMPSSFNPPKDPNGVRHLRFRDLAVAFDRSYGTQLTQLRHGVQHVDQRQAELQQAAEPVWGHLTWAVDVDPVQGILHSCATLGGGPPELNNVAFLNPVGRQMRARVDLIELHAYGGNAPLSSCYHEVAGLAGHMERSLESWKDYQRDLTGVIIMTIETVDDESQEAPAKG
jgi:hypothetical protein